MSDVLDFYNKAKKYTSGDPFGSSAGVSTYQPTDTGYTPAQSTTPTVTGAQWAPPTRTSDPLGTGQGFSYGNPGFDDPATKQYFDLLSQVVSHLTGAQDRSGEDQLSKILNDTITQYQQPAFSDANLAGLRTSANDQLLRERDTALQNEQRRLGQSGIAPSSPYAQSAIRDVERGYQTQQATNDQNVNNFALNTQLQRPQQIVGLAQILQQLSQQKRSEELDNFSKALGLTGSGVSLTEGRLNAAQNGGGLGDISSLINAILGVQNATNAGNQTTALNNQAWYDQLGKLLAAYGKPNSGNTSGSHT